MNKTPEELCKISEKIADYAKEVFEKNKLGMEESDHIMDSLWIGLFGNSIQNLNEVAHAVYTSKRVYYLTRGMTQILMHFLEEKDKENNKETIH